MTDGKQRERVEVPVRVGGQPDAEVDVRLRPFRVATWPDRAHDLPFADRRPDGQGDRPEVDEGDRIPVRCANRQTEPFPRQPAGEGDNPRRRSPHVGPRRRADVDPTVLAARVRVFLGDERTEHRPLDGPGPGRRTRGVSERHEHSGHEDDRSVA
ncbi:MAG: hypothetical protein AABM30_06065 [Actinomycetota bacterium]